jgi:predicted transcriptional regulator YheO
VSVLGDDGEPVATFGQLEATSGAKTEIPFPDSSDRLLIEIDTKALEAADRVLHAIAEPHHLVGMPYGALANLEDALEQLIAQGEVHVGKPLDLMSRAEKQQLVRYLDERGAFQLRKAVEGVAEMLGVSRFTVYNYLEAIRVP